MERGARRQAPFLDASDAGTFQLLRAMPTAVRRVAGLSAFVEDAVDALLPEA
ncbi:MAG: hypothetical protein JST05_06065 [Acidobacteria bacterium]|nr:hypothetical protein [Acidobacteriota bacterium]